MLFRAVCTTKSAAPMNVASFNDMSLSPVQSVELHASAIAGADIYRKMRAYIVAGSNLITVQCGTSYTDATIVAPNGNIGIWGFWFTR